MVYLVPASISALVLTSAVPQSPPPPCVSYRGAYGSQTISHLWFTSSDCLASYESAQNSLWDVPEFQVIPYELNPEVDIVHLSPRSLDENVFGQQGSWSDKVHSLIDTFQVSSFDSTSDQVVFTAPKAAISILSSTEDSCLIVISQSLLSSFISILPAAVAPVVVAPTVSSFKPVPEHDESRVHTLLSELTFNSAISKALQEFPSIFEIKETLEYLTGASHQLWNSRHSFSTGGKKAGAWIQSQFESYGAVCEHQLFRNGYNPNILCLFKKDSDASLEEEEESAIVVIGAHYDSRGTFGDLRAPGADDDGSGTSMLINIARAIDEQGIKFKHDVILAAFAGEEQGLVGSSHFASTLRSNDTDVLLMIQADMLGYRKPGEPLQIAFPDRFDLPIARELIGNVSTLYVPELAVGLTSACCSDHQSFFNQGYASTQVFERRGPIADPMYHNSGDVVERVGYDIEQIRAISQVVFATLLEVAALKA